MSAKIRWFGHAAHFIGGSKCRFHLATQVGKYLVSTVGELWWEQGSRRITANLNDPKWYAEHGAKKGDDYDHAHMLRFGFDTLGADDRTYETMVFKAGKPCATKECGCGLPTIDGHEIDVGGYTTAGAATVGHMKLVAKWAKNTRRTSRRTRTSSEGTR